MVSGHVLEIITVKIKKKGNFESYSVARVKIYDVIKGYRILLGAAVEKGFTLPHNF